MVVPVKFAAPAIQHLALFAERLRKKPDPVTMWLWDQFDDRTRKLAQAFQSAWSDHEEFRAAVCENLNKIIAGDLIYDEKRFGRLVLRPETHALLRKNVRGDDLIRLNRQLLEDSYPQELSRDYEFDFLSQEFDVRVVGWARDRFSEEITTNFKRARTFDALRSKLALTILRRASMADLTTLARVLPTQVLSDSPDNTLRRNALKPDEKETVEKLRSEFKTDDEKNASLFIGEFSRMHHKDVKREFNAAVRMGNQMIGEIAKQEGCENSGGARGEWGLRFLNGTLKFTISIKLARYMLLDYIVGVAKSDATRHLRFCDNYLGILGFGKGEWIVENAEQFPSKLAKAIEFAFWHTREYEALLEELRGRNENDGA